MRGQQYSLGQLLETLGRDGWEAVHMLGSDDAVVVGQSYTAWPSNINMQLLILFKRRR